MYVKDMISRPGIRFSILHPKGTVPIIRIFYFSGGVLFKITETYNYQIQERFTRTIPVPDEVLSEYLEMPIILRSIK